MLNNNTLHLLMERQDRQCSTLSRNANPDDNIEYSNVHRLYMSDAHIIAPSSLLNHKYLVATHVMSVTCLRTCLHTQCVLK